MRQKTMSKRKRPSSTVPALYERVVVPTTPYVREGLLVKRTHLSKGKTRLPFHGLFATVDAPKYAFLGYYTGRFYDERASSSEEDEDDDASYAPPSHYAVNGSGYTVVPPGEHSARGVDARRYPLAMMNEPPAGRRAGRSWSVAADAVPAWPRPNAWACSRSTRARHSRGRGGHFYYGDARRRHYGRKPTTWASGARRSSRQRARARATASRTLARGVPPSLKITSTFSCERSVFFFLKHLLRALENDMWTRALGPNVTVVGNGPLRAADRAAIAQERTAAPIVRFNDVKTLRAGERTTLRLVRWPSAHAAPCAAPVWYVTHLPPSTLPPGVNNYTLVYERDKREERARPAAGRRARLSDCPGCGAASITTDGRGTLTERSLSARQDPGIVRIDVFGMVERSVSPRLCQSHPGGALLYQMRRAPDGERVVRGRGRVRPRADVGVWYPAPLGVHAACLVPHTTILCRIWYEHLSSPHATHVSRGRGRSVGAVTQKSSFEE